MARNWCFTLNNWKPEDEEKMREEFKDGRLKYYVCGYEEAPTTGTKHIQGYFEWSNSVKLVTLKNKWPNGHFERRRGSSTQAAEYCKKTGSFSECGTISVARQGKRTDLQELADGIVEGDTDADIVDKYPEMLIKYPRGIEKLRSALLEDRRAKPMVYWFWGETGTGKTRRAYGDGVGKYIKDGTQWWDGYNGTDDVIIDDFDGHWPFRDLLRLLDRYPYQGQYKGGYVKVSPKNIYITADRPPDKAYENHLPHMVSQLLRRIDYIVHMKSESEVAGGNTDSPAT